MTRTQDHQQLERLTFFSDAVFAIAMTLLVVEIHLPPLATFSDHALAQGLLDLIPDYIGFLISFLVLARFWSGHHFLMGMLARATPGLVWANLLMLLAVAFMPFPTAIISKYTELRVGIGFYTFWLLVLGLLNRRIVMLASNPALAEEEADRDAFRQSRIRSWIPIVIAIGAFAAGMVSPGAGLVALLAGSPIVTWIVHRIATRKAA